MYPGGVKVYLKFVHSLHFFPPLQKDHSWALCPSHPASDSTKEQSVKRSGLQSSVKFCQRALWGETHIFGGPERIRTPRTAKKEKDYPWGHLSNLRVQQSLCAEETLMQRKCGHKSHLQLYKMADIMLWVKNEELPYCVEAERIEKNHTGLVYDK